MSQTALMLCFVLSTCVSVRKMETTAPVEIEGPHDCAETSCPLPAHKPAQPSVAPMETMHPFAQAGATDPEREARCHERAKADAFARYSALSKAYQDAREQELYEQCVAHGTQSSSRR